jgi:hypothetical protein
MYIYNWSTRFWTANWKMNGFAAWWESWKEWITKTVRTKRTEDTLQSFHLLTYIIKITVRKLAVKQDRFADFGFDG